MGEYTYDPSKVVVRFAGVEMRPATLQEIMRREDVGTITRNDGETDEELVKRIKAEIEDREDAEADAQRQQEQIEGNERQDIDGRAD